MKRISPPMLRIGLAAALPSLLVACGGSETSSSGTPSDAPSTYTFESRFEAGKSSVAYSGQTARHILIRDLAAHIEGLTARVEQGTLTPAQGEVAAELGFFFDFDSDTAGDLEHGLRTSLPAVQTTYDEVSSGKDLVGKVAGNDPVGQHLDWSAGVIGAPTGTAPEALVRGWFDRVDALVVQRANGDLPMTPEGAPIAEAFVTPEGQDLRQLIQKFLDGAIGFSQAADDYLDDDTDGKGLLSDNVEASGTYTALEHQWDEGFGYFGAARNYMDYTDEEIAARGGRDGFANGYNDADRDGRIDLTAEINLGHSQNAAKRDLGARAATDLTKDAFEAFVKGRHIISSAGGPLDAAQTAELAQARDQALQAWEKAIAATAVHYINDTLQDMGAFGTPDYSFEDHAKHWSELKGFALSLQFNRRSPLSKDDLRRLHDLIGDAPALSDGADIEGYKAGLLEARALLGTAYDFASENLGDADGKGGW